MCSTRLLSAALIAIITLSPTTAFAKKDRDFEAELFLTLFRATCANDLVASYNKDKTMASIGPAFIERFAGNTCDCVIDGIKQQGTPWILAFLDSENDDASLDPIVERCTIRAMKPLIGTICTAYAAKALSEDETKTTCECAQRRTDASSDDTFAQIMNSDKDDSFAPLIDPCLPKP